MALSAAALTVWWVTPPQDLSRWRAGRTPQGWASRERQQQLWIDEGIERVTQHRYVPLSEIPIDLTLALLVSEDIDFFDHGALDPVAVGEAVGEWTETGRLRGASTVSQQLARSLFLSQRRSLGRKLSEWRLAWWLERRLSKRRILELYVNVMEFGPGLFGAEAAAQAYYDTSVKSLTPEHAAGLAAALPSPGRDNPSTATELWRFRQETILRRMEGAAWLREKLEAPAGSP